jgi:hypothetical protein
MAEECRLGVANWPKYEVLAAARFSSYERIPFQIQVKDWKDKSDVTVHCDPSDILEFLERLVPIELVLGPVKDYFGMLMYEVRLPGGRKVEIRKPPKTAWVIFRPDQPSDPLKKEAEVFFESAEKALASLQTRYNRPCDGHYSLGYPCRSRESK